MSVPPCKHQIAGSARRPWNTAGGGGVAQESLCGLKLASERRRRRMNRFEEGLGVIGTGSVRCPYGLGWVRCPWARAPRARAAAAC